MLRRTKHTTLDGQPLLLLPPITIKDIKLELVDGERELYMEICGGAAVKVNKWYEQGEPARYRKKCLSSLYRHPVEELGFCLCHVDTPASALLSPEPLMRVESESPRPFEGYRGPTEEPHRVQRRRSHPRNAQWAIDAAYHSLG